MAVTLFCPKCASKEVKTRLGLGSSHLGDSLWLQCESCKEESPKVPTYKGDPYSAEKFDREFKGWYVKTVTKKIAPAVVVVSSVNMTSYVITEEFYASDEDAIAVHGSRFRKRLMDKAIEIEEVVSDEGCASDR